MTSKLIGSPIKVKPDESMVGSPLYGWGSPPPQNVVGVQCVARLVLLKACVYKKCHQKLYKYCV